MIEFPDIDWREVVSHLYRLAIAFALTLPIGWDRESVRRGSGLRTFPLVAVGSCGYILMGDRASSSKSRPRRACSTA